MCNEYYSLVVKEPSYFANQAARHRPSKGRGDHDRRDDGSTGKFFGKWPARHERDQSPVAYNITAWCDKNRRRVDGTVSAPMETLETAFRAGGVTLQLQTGEVVEIVITSVDAGTSRSNSLCSRFLSEGIHGCFRAAAA